MCDYDENYQKKCIKKYLRLKDEFETYQNFTESTIQMLTEKNIKLEKKLDAITNIVAISKYINSYLSDENLIPMINDTIIGILGATYSSIYILENNKLVKKASNFNNKINFDYKEEYRELLNGNPFIINSREPLFDCKSLKSDIHSLIGVPIYIREKFIGYILVEHALNNFFGHEHIKFISTIANQIAISLENNALYNKIREMAIKDPLLGVYNRKYFFELLNDKVEKNKEQKFALVMMDIDNFKRTNDLYGHQFGDEVLRQTVKIIKENIDTNDVISRYGGEEIVIYIEDFTNIDDVYNKINKIRMKINKNIVFYRNIKSNITASFGIGHYPFDGNDIYEVINVADSRLYIAKRTGKNKVVNK